MDELIAAELGRMRLTILKQAHAIETLKSAIDARDKAIAEMKMKASEPELPLGAAFAGGTINGRAH